MLLKTKIFYGGLAILLFTSVAKIYTAGKQIGVLEGKIAILQNENRQLETRIKLITAELKECDKAQASAAKAQTKTEKELTACAEDLKKEKARNVRKEVRAKK